MRWIISLAGGVAAAVTGAAVGGHFRPETGTLVGQIRAPRIETVQAGRRRHVDDQPAFDLASTAPTYPIAPADQPLYVDDSLPPPPPPPEETPQVRRSVSPARLVAAPVLVAAAPAAPAAGDWAQNAHQGGDPVEPEPVVIPERTPYY